MLYVTCAQEKRAEQIGHRCPNCLRAFTINVVRGWHSACHLCMVVRGWCLTRVNSEYRVNFGGGR
jgi:GTP cyclohydrolase I